MVRNSFSGEEVLNLPLMKLSFRFKKLNRVRPCGLCLARERIDIGQSLRCYLGARVPKPYTSDSYFEFMSTEYILLENF